MNDLQLHTRSIVDHNGHKVFAHGTDVPADGTDGYAPGCVFCDTDSSLTYVNTGTETSCAFTALSEATLSSGVTIDPGSDEDCTVFTVSVTGDPALTWDESESAFGANVPLRIISNETHGVYIESEAATSNGLRVQQNGAGTGSVSIHVLDGGGDAQVGFGVDDAEGVSIGHSWHIGIDNSRDDDFVISAGESVGAADNFYLDRSTGGVGFGAAPPTTANKTAGMYGVFTTSAWNVMCMTNSVADATAKNFRYALPHYTIAEEYMMGMMLSSNTTANTVYLGGGSGAFNAATSISFYAAANQTTTTGTLIATITTAGLTLTDAYNIVVGTTTGTQIATAPTQKIGFFGATPVVQQTNADWTTLANVVTALKNLGLIADP